VEVSLARDTVEICTVMNTFGAMKHSWKWTRICGTANVSTPVIPSERRIAQYSTKQTARILSTRASVLTGCIVA
jgi:hypothetical protein